MFPGARTLSFRPSLGLLRRHRSAAFPGIRRVRRWDRCGHPGRGLRLRLCLCLQFGLQLRHRQCWQFQCCVTRGPWRPPLHPWHVVASTVPGWYGCYDKCFSSPVLCFGRYFTSRRWWPADCEFGAAHNSSLLLFDIQQDSPLWFELHVGGRRRPDPQRWFYTTSSV